MRLTTTVRLEDGSSSDVLLDVEPETLVGHLAAALGRTVGVRPEGLFLDGAELDDSSPVDQTRIREGSVLALSRAAAVSQPRLSMRGWQLHVVAGRGAGAIHDLPIGSYEIGREAQVLLDDERVSRRHARLDVTATGATVVDLGSRNGTTLDGIPVAGEPVPIRPGQVLALGDALLTVAVAREPDAAVQPGAAGVVEFTRSPRILPPRPPRHVVLPSAPEPPRRHRMPVIAMVAPLVMGLVMATLFKQWQFLLFTLMSPVMMIGNVVSARRASGHDHRVAQREYADRLARAKEDIAASLAAETAWRRERTPDAAVTMMGALLPTRRLWERRRTDDDALLLRVGTTDLPSDLTIGTERSAEPPEHRKLFAVPVTLPLRELGVVGVAGPPDDARRVAHWLVAQLAAYHAPRDLALTVLAPVKGSSWQWVRWLPQARPAEMEDLAAHVGTDPETVGTRVADLLSLLRQRRDVAKSGVRSDRQAFPAHVVVLDGARSLRAVPGVSQLLDEGPDVGIFAICIEAEERLLPEECAATVSVEAGRTTRLAVHAQGQAPLDGVLVEMLRAEDAEHLARAMAPVRDISPDEGESTLPDSARLLDVLALEPPTVDGVRARWQIDGQTTAMTIGAGTDGPFTLDLRRDGPHGLVAGTTGSGKSELLQTMIASLSVANRPDAMNFVLVDYKGGSAFKDCVRLPHTVGMVTDLDAHLVRRALTSLGAELKRREHQLAAAGVKDVEDYQDLSARTPGELAPLPRLVLVIDEFASMARELPDFVAGLVNIAQRGRSLGIHLLLATQRPSGVVSPEIRANTNLRISLRVTDAGDSSDVLDAPDAARIAKSTPGRGYARLGHGALLPFQAARVGGRRPGARRTSVRPPFVAELGWTQLGYAVPRPDAAAVREEDALTDLALLVEVVEKAAAAGGFARQRSPWLPALPELVLLADVAPATGAGACPGAAAEVRLTWGLEDDPAEQRQYSRVFDLLRDGHLLVVGSARTGRSQLLRTLAASVAEYDVADVHLYGVDCGNGSLRVLDELPHTGAVVGRAEPERAVRLFARLQGEAERRQAVLAAGGFASIAEQRQAVPAEHRLPHIVLLVDRWEGFTPTLGELDGGALVDAILAFVREGASVGIHVVVTGDRSLATGRISSLTSSSVVLRLADKADVSLLGLQPRDVPDHQPPGRAVASDSGHEVHAALLVADPAATAQASALAALGREARERCVDVPAHLRPLRVDNLPARVAVADALRLLDGTVRPGEVLVPIGLGGDDLRLVGADIAATPAFVVAGPSRSGRSTALVFVARALLRQEVQVVLAAPRPSPLRDLAGEPGVRAVVTDAHAPLEEWTAAVAGDGRVVVVVDDGEMLKDSAAGPLFSAIARRAAGAPRGIVLGGNADSLGTGFMGWQVDVKKEARQGALLSPQDAGHGELIGISRLPRSTMSPRIVPGRALVHIGDGSLVGVTVPE